MNSEKLTNSMSLNGLPLFQITKEQLEFTSSKNFQFVLYFVIIIIILLLFIVNKLLKNARKNKELLENVKSVSKKEINEIENVEYSKLKIAIQSLLLEIIHLENLRQNLEKEINEIKDAKDLLENEVKTESEKQIMRLKSN